MPRLSLIVAMAANGVIGRGGDLPWRLPADLARFRRITMGHVLLMGRRTYESIGRPLPGRTSLVLTRQPSFRPPGVLVASNLDQALAQVADRDEVFVIGGADIYRQTLPRVERLYVTRVLADVDGDVYFPEFDFGQWEQCEDVYRPADEKNGWPVRFQVYCRDRVARQP